QGGRARRRGAGGRSAAHRRAGAQLRRRTPEAPGGGGPMSGLPAASRFGQQRRVEMPELRCRTLLALVAAAVAFAPARALPADPLAEVRLLAVRPVTEAAAD